LDPDPNPDPPDQNGLGLLDLDPLVGGMDPDPNPSIILLSSRKNSKKKPDSYCFVTSFGLFIFEK
jgi:hypothetical protein